MTKSTAPKTGPKFPTIIRDPEQIVSSVKKDLIWVAIATVISVAVAVGTYILIKPA